MEKEKVYELRIDDEDEISGIDSISLVSEPAIEINWVAFNKEKEYFNIPDGEDDKYLFMLEQFGQDEQLLLDQGYKPFKIGNFEVQNFMESYPNAPSEWNTNEFLVRYKYILNPEVQNNRNPIIPTTRDFCRDMIRKNMVFRIEDMDRLTNDQGTSALVWRGGWNCRHSWSKILYKKDTDIVNKASVNKGKVLDVNGFPNDMVPDLSVLGYGQPNTRTRYPSFSKEKMSYPLFEDKESAEIYGEKILGCKGSHEHKIEDKIMYMPCEKHPEELGYDVSTLPDYVDEITTGKTSMSKQEFQIDNEKKIVVGPAMVPNLKIFRKDKNGNPYYVFFSEDTIKMIAEKYMKNKFIDNNDIDHNGKAASDVYVIESWIKEDDEDKSNKYGFQDLPVGTWFVSMKVKNDFVWDKIKNGELNGFSVSGFFEEVEKFKREQKELEFLKELAELLKNIE